MVSLQQQFKYIDLAVEKRI